MVDRALKAIAGAKLLDTPGQKNVLGSTMLFVSPFPRRNACPTRDSPSATPSQAQPGQARVADDRRQAVFVLALVAIAFPVAAGERATIGEPARECASASIRTIRRSR